MNIEKREPSPDQISDINEKRILSDAEAIKGGAEVTPGGRVSFTDGQIKEAKREMRTEISPQDLNFEELNNIVDTLDKIIAWNSDDFYYGEMFSKKNLIETDNKIWPAICKLREIKERKNTEFIDGTLETLIKQLEEIRSYSEPRSKTLNLEKAKYLFGTFSGYVKALKHARHLTMQ
jgi:hypothetical protein